MTAPYSKIQIRRDTGANWTNNNPILLEGEIGLVPNYRNLRVGNGTDHWNDLVNLLSGYPQVANFAALPVASSVYTGMIYICIASQGTWILGTKKDAGAYYCDGATWSPMPYVQDYFMASDFAIKSATGYLQKFDISALTADRIATWPNRAFTLDNITTGTTSNGTGFVKANGSVISFDNSTYLNINGIPGGQTAIAGTEVGDYFTFQSTSGAGTATGIAHKFTGGTNGGTLLQTILNNGTTIIGSGISRSIGGSARMLQIESTGTPPLASISIIKNSNEATGPTLYFGKTKSASLGGNTACLIDYSLGTISFVGANGTNLINISAYISSFSDENFTTSAQGGRLVFFTTLNATITPLERMRITNAGLVGFGTTAPTSLNHLNNSGAAIVATQYTNLATGTAIGNGFHVGIDASGNATINQKENLPLIFSTYNTERLRILPGGGTSERINLPNYFDTSATADTVGDTRVSNQAGVYRIERCTVANATKTSGTWVTILELT